MSYSGEELGMDIHPSIEKDLFDNRHRPFEDKDVSINSEQGQGVAHCRKYLDGQKPALIIMCAYMQDTKH